MKSSVFYNLVTVAALIGSLVIVVGKMIPPEELQLLLTKGVIPASLVSKTSSAGGVNSGSGAEAIKELTPEEVSKTSEELQQLLDQLPVLREIPWQSSEIAASFANRSARPCRLIAPQNPVETRFGEIKPEAGQLLNLRTTAFQIGLEVDAKARLSLPSLSKATIENYLSEHVLSIQPEICRSENGEFLFTGMVHAAFFSRLSPSVTRTPEAMVGEAVNNLRVLGVLPISSTPPASPDSNTLDGAQPLLADDSADQRAVVVNRLPRTLVMAFQYHRDQILSSSLTTQGHPEFELIFLHLLPQKDNSLTPSLAVFTSAEGATILQELDLSAQQAGRSSPAVKASVRFEKFKVMGQYPSDPVVTGLSNQIRSAITMEELKGRIAGQPGDPAVALNSILSQLHQESESATDSPLSSR